jgi:hypothetical protein
MPTYTFSPTTPCQQRSTYDDTNCADAAVFGDEWPFYVGALSERRNRYPYSTYTALYDIIDEQADTYLTTTSKRGVKTTWWMNDTWMPSLSCPDCNAYARAGGENVVDDNGATSSDALPYLSFPFSVSTSSSSDATSYPMFPSLSTTRKRYFIKPNQVLVGPLFTQVRTSDGKCAAMPKVNQDFQDYYFKSCTVADSTIGAKPIFEPFGTDPTFLQTSELYRDSNTRALTQMYVFANESDGAVFSTEDGFDSSRYKSIDSNEISDGGVPYGFWPDQSSGGKSVKGFPIIFDININASRAAEFLAFMQDGGYMDSNTQSVTISMIVFNPEMGLFAQIQVTSALLGSGGVTFDYSILPFEANKYDLANPVKPDVFRFVLEIVFVTMLLLLFLKELAEMYSAVQDARPHDSILSVFRGLSRRVSMTPSYWHGHHH